MGFTLRLIYYDLEAIMVRILSTALLVGAVIFLGGVLFGWPYSLFLGIVVLLALNLIEMARQR